MGNSKQSASFVEEGKKEREYGEIEVYFQDFKDDFEGQDGVSQNEVQITRVAFIQDQSDGDFRLPSKSTEGLFTRKFPAISIDATSALDEKNSQYEKHSYQPSQVGYLRRDLGDEDGYATNFDRKSDHTFYSAFHKQGGPISDNTSIIDVSSRSTSLAGGGHLAPPQRRLPPKLDLTKITLQDCEGGDIDDIQIQIQIKDDQIKNIIGVTEAEDHEWNMMVKKAKEGIKEEGKQDLESPPI